MSHIDQSTVRDRLLRDIWADDCALLPPHSTHHQAGKDVRIVLKYGISPALLEAVA